MTGPRVKPGGAEPAGAAGANAVRVHRSWIVNADHISRIEPTGEGDIKIEMKDGAIVPGSRRYRGNLNLG